jgi:hypothetical protein
MRIRTEKRTTPPFGVTTHVSGELILWPVLNPMLHWVKTANGIFGRHRLKENDSGMDCRLLFPKKV